MLNEMEQQVLDDSATLTLSEEIDGETFKKVYLLANKIHVLVINCEGGSFYDAMGIADLVSLTRMHTRGFGAVMSAALLVFVAGENRKASKHTIFMYHGSTFPNSGENFSDKKRQLAQAEAEEWLAANYMASRTKMSAEFWKQKADEGDFFFTAEQAVEFGIISEIL